MKNKVIAEVFVLKEETSQPGYINYCSILPLVANAGLLQADKQKEAVVTLDKYPHAYNYSPYFNGSFCRVSMDIMNRAAAVLLLPLAAVLSIIPLTAAIIVKPFYLNQTGIIFTQRRVGYEGKSFEIIKFKTRFHDNKFHEHIPFPWIKFIGLDELPQLINIIKGDMVFIGGRPLIKSQLMKDPDLKEKYYAYVGCRRPGIISIAAILGRIERLKFSTHEITQLRTSSMHP